MLLLAFFGSFGMAFSTVTDAMVFGGASCITNGSGFNGRYSG